MGGQPSDSDYLQKLRDGDPATERHFWSYYGHLLDIKLRSRVRSQHLVEEARQETILRVFATLRDPAKRQPENLGAFINAVCNNVVFEIFRAETRTQQIPENAPDPADERESPELSVVNEQRKSVVMKVLNEMPDRDRELLREIFLNERDKDEVCREYRIDRNYLRVVLHRARLRFRATMESMRGRAAMFCLA